MNLFVAPDPLRPGSRRLRAAWRIAGQLVILFTLGVVFLLPLGLLQLFGVGQNVDLFLAQQVVGILAITASVFIARRLLDRRSLRSLGIQIDRRAAWDLLAGILIAALMMAAIFLIEHLAGWTTIQAFAWQEPAHPQAAGLAELLAMLLVFIAVGWQEELLSRGYLLQNLIDGLNPFWAVLLSSAAFALAHLGNPDVNATAIPGLMLAGAFFAWAYLRTRRLWLPIGLHIGWNFFEGPVFGFPVSGLDFAGLVRQAPRGAQLLTGGAFGPEAGLVLLPALALGFALVWGWARFRRAD